jgi:hypothetical protein
LDGSPATLGSLWGVRNLRAYYITMGAGLAISLVVIPVTLPLLTGPASMRFEQAGTHHARSG